MFFRFWVGLYDNPPSSRIDASERNWEWRIDGSVTALTTHPAFVSGIRVNLCCT